MYSCVCVCVLGTGILLGAACSPQHHNGASQYRRKSPFYFCLYFCPLEYCYMPLVYPHTHTYTCIFFCIYTILLREGLMRSGKIAAHVPKIRYVLVLFLNIKKKHHILAHTYKRQVLQASNCFPAPPPLSP